VANDRLSCERDTVRHAILAAMIYADYAATTPVDPAVLDAMLPYLRDVYFNASSTHAGGMMVQQAVMKARMQVAAHIGARMTEIVFTSGATEAINLAILGAARQAERNGSTRRRIVTVATEHAAVIDASTYLSERGWDVVFLGVDRNGRLNVEEVGQHVNGDTLLLSVMTVNNETGVYQDLEPLAAIAHANGAFFMTDATQAYGKMPLHVDEIGIDLMTFSGHKIYGPKGVGVLFIRNRKDAVCEIEPMFYGGGQERGVRSGTLNVPGIVGLAVAGEIAHACMEADATRISALRDRFEAGLEGLEGVHINGHRLKRSATTSNVTFSTIDADVLLLSLPDVCASKGSACSSAKPKPSHVLTAMGRSPEAASCTLRFSFGRFTTDAEVDQLIADVRSAHRNAEKVPA